MKNIKFTCDEKEWRYKLCLRQHNEFSEHLEYNEDCSVVFS